jgi:hypothetical protein
MSENSVRASRGAGRRGRMRLGGYRRLALSAMATVFYKYYPAETIAPGALRQFHQRFDPTVYP